MKRRTFFSAIAALFVPVLPAVAASKWTVSAPAPLTCIRRVWSNGKLVWQEEVPHQERAVSGREWGEIIWRSPKRSISSTRSGL